MLVKLTTGVNFTIILYAAFMPADPESAKRQPSCQSFLHLESMSIKAGHKTLMKLTPDRAGPSFYGRLLRMLRR
jgi:hypothetical protein